MATTNTRKKNKGALGKTKESDNPEKNPLLKIDEKEGFKIWTDNLLSNPGAMIFPGFETFDMGKEKNHFETDKINKRSQIVIVLRYYEYLCVAKLNFEYVIPILESGLTARDVFDMIKHCLKTRLMMNVPSFETVLEMEISYMGKIKYN